MTTVAVTGPTGVFGHALVSLLERDERVDRVIGVARRPFDPAGEGWSKLAYRRGDVRDRDALARSFEGAAQVAHLAFAKFGHATREDLRAINIDGTLNALEAAATVGARRFVFASSVAAYGFHADNPEPITEDWPARGSERWFYSREKAELERALTDAVAGHPGLELTILRPTVVVGPRTAETWDEILPPALRPWAHRAAALPGRLPAVPPPYPMQFVAEDDVGAALRLALLDGPSGVYNLAGDGLVPSSTVARELGLAPIPIPRSLLRGIGAALVRLPRRPAALEAAEILTHPLIVDSGKARRELGWRPRYTGIEALRTAVRGAPTALSDRDIARAADRPAPTSERSRSRFRFGA